MMKKWHLSLLVASTAFLAACDSGSQSKGFTLPEGDAAVGQVVFLEKQCTDCHSVKGVEFELGDMEPEMALQLGGEMRKVYTYGELVTSIINPSHKISARFPTDTLTENDMSKMRTYNDVLTVQELTDLVAFLDAHYELEPYDVTRYSRYTY